MSNTFTVSEIQRATVAYTLDPTSPPIRGVAGMLQGSLVRVNGHVILVISQDIVRSVNTYRERPTLSVRGIEPADPDGTMEQPLRLPYGHASADEGGLLAFDLSAVQRRPVRFAALDLHPCDGELPDESALVIPFEPFKTLGIECAHYAAGGSAFDIGLPALSEIAGKSRVATVVGVVGARRTIVPVAELLGLAHRAIHAGRHNRRGALLRYRSEAERLRTGRWS